MGRATCPRLLPPVVTQHHSRHLPACHPAGQAALSLSCHVLLPDLHTKAPALMAPCSHREHQLMNAKDDMRLGMFTCLVISTYGHDTTGPRGYKHSCAAPNRRESMQGTITLHCLLRYPQYSMHGCQQMALIICLTCSQPWCKKFHAN